MKTINPEKANLITSWISVILLPLFAYWGISSQLTPGSYFDSENPNDFSVDRVMSHLRVIARETHYIGAPYHKEVRAYLIKELEALGLKPQVQPHRVFEMSPRSTQGMVVKNVVAKIKGSGNGKALLVMAHYDSAAPHSPGASDAGSGVATILEGLRVFLAKNKQPKNDIIVLFSDAEEAGLMGTRAFIEHNPLVKNVGLALNFEARGSGGPSYMFMETNGKNGKLLAEFMNANPHAPNTNSILNALISKLGVTESEPLREISNINSFLFGYIGDFFDYHTTQDTPERANRSSLAHHADYLMSLLNHFAFSDLENLEGKQDQVFVNLPLVKLLSYPVSLAFPLFIITFVLIVTLIVLGVKRGQISLKNGLKSFIPFLLTLVANCVVTFGLWRLILLIHPSYNDILHRFPYNGYYYLGAFMALNCGLSVLIYQKWLAKYRGSDLVIAPLTIWLALNLLMAIALPGGSFLIIPVFLVAVMLAISLFTEWSASTKQIVFTLLSLPLLYILSPIIKLLPIALTLMAAALGTFFLVLAFGLLTPVLSLASNLKYVKYGSVGVTVILLAIATSMSGFNKDRRKPNFVRFYHNADKNVSYWGSFNGRMDPFLAQFFGEQPNKGKLPEEVGMGHPFIKAYKKTENRDLKPTKIILHQDTVHAGKRFIDFTISPQRAINMISLIAKNDLKITKMTVNGTPASAVNYKGFAFERKKGTKILNYILTDADKELRITLLMENKPLEFALEELSYDLLSNKHFKIQPRADYMMPQIGSDAIQTTRTVKF
ncbi:hypothetical protein BKI52_30310 [marine bacterium AO1-C]|nr:hypothetical protein BKI52_30310 [marine bacterium AO1-C]